jgi:hypothetical protein
MFFYFQDKIDIGSYTKPKLSEIHYNTFFVMRKGLQVSTGLTSLHNYLGISRWIYARTLNRLPSNGNQKTS